MSGLHFFSLSMELHWWCLDWLQWLLLLSFLILHLFLKAHGDNPGRTTRVAAAVVDTFVWQALASVIIPGFTINRVCATSLYLLGRTTKWPLPVRKWTTTAIGLSTIPFIITPIDRLAYVVCVRFHMCMFTVHYYVRCKLCKLWCLLPACAWWTVWATLATQWVQS